MQNAKLIAIGAILIAAGPALTYYIMTDDAPEPTHTPLPTSNNSTDDNLSGLDSTERAYVDLRHFCEDYVGPKRFEGDHWCSNATDELTEMIAWGEIGNESWRDIYGP